MVSRPTSRRGRPKLSVSVTKVSIHMPTAWVDLCAHQALARDVSMATVFREAVAAMLIKRGELR